MNAPKRIQLSRAAGWRMPENTVKVDRTSPWGNPYRIGEPVDLKMLKRWDWRFSPAGKLIVCENAAEASARFHHCLLWDGAIHQHVRDKLGGKNLACWCAHDQPCHSEALLWLANTTREEVNAIHKAADEQIMAHAAEVMRSATADDVKGDA